jgi:hypothetical protein
LQVRHIPTWGERAETIAASQQARYRNARNKVTNVIKRTSDVGPQRLDVGGQV